MIVPPRTLVAGAPARVRKELSGDALVSLQHSAQHYVDLSRSYLEQGLEHGG
jgi:carbonic anhydrase/acetyltransferase-like protein (isoleucine patch superfamily)